MKNLFTILLLSFCFLAAADFVRFRKIVEYNGYDANEYEVTTSDGYILTLLRIQLVFDAGPREMQNGTDVTDKQIIEDIFGFESLIAGTDKDRAILLMHAANMNADSWVINKQKSQTLPFILADMGYDVWLGNNRGVNDYSSHESLSVNDSEYWNFTFADMGTFDVPAMINFITNQTGLDQIDYIGFERGNQQMFYALALFQDYIGPKIGKFISLAPCVYQAKSVVKLYDGYFGSLDDAGINVIYGPNWTEQFKELCKVYVEPCDTLGPQPVGQPISVKDFKHQTQLFFSQAFQEYIEDYKMGQLGTKIPTENITQVPMYYIAGEQDQVCSYELIEPKVFKAFKLPKAKQTFSYPKMSHDDIFTSPAQYEDALTSILKANTKSVNMMALAIFSLIFY